MSDPVTRLLDAIAITGNLCAEIKKTRHIGHSHTQLDLLEASLASAPFSPSINIPSSSHSELEGYLSQMGEINAWLEHIAHPKKHCHNGGGGHGNGNGNGNENRHHHHHHHHHQRHEHKEMEDPHFGDLRVAWEAVRDGVEKLVEGKGVAQEQVTERLEVKLEIKEEVKAEETKAEETEAEETNAERKTEVKTIDEQDVAEVKVSEVEEVKAQQNERSEA
ncbi:hypothetical protein F5882DRAFT_185241 [Hyaloscypha sp. PMI_1271]|nr:hypothetical protein F5882DRAFT_185241 [Hyaloscypha sp. PMI_1271]